MDELEAIRARWAAAHPGPWYWERQTLADQPRWKTGFCGPPSLFAYADDAYIINRGCSDCQEKGDGDEATLDAIENAPTDVAALLAALDAATAERDRYRAALVALTADEPPWVGLYGGSCPYCDGYGDTWDDTQHRATCPWLLGRAALTPGPDGTAGVGG